MIYLSNRSAMTLLHYIEVIFSLFPFSAYDAIREIKPMYQIELHYVINDHMCIYDMPIYEKLYHYMTVEMSV